MGKEPRCKWPWQLQNLTSSLGNTNLTTWPGHPGPMGKPHVLFCLNSRGVEGNAACRLHAQGTSSLLPFPHVPQDWGTWSWIAWGPPPLSRDGLGSPGISPAMLGNRWALGWLGCGACGGWGSAWCSEGCFWLHDRFEPRLIKAGAARGISDLTDPGLWYRSDYPRREEAGKAWSGSQKQLSKYRFVSLLFPQFGLPETL